MSEKNFWVLLRENLALAHIGLKRHQAMWHESYWNAEGKSWILLRVGRSGMMLFKGSDADTIFRMPNTQSLIDLAVWKVYGNMKKEDWKSLKKEFKNERREIPKKTGASSHRNGAIN